ncbi:MAG: SCO family protein [Gemmatimonadota bacterium]
MRLSILALAAALACTSDAPTPGNFRGVLRDPPLDKPDFSLTDQGGRRYNLRLETAGKVTLLFFGYTHCPDVCPLHAANVAAVLRRMPFAERDEIRFIFVTTDPERDTAERLKQWLSAFDPTFVGLRGTVAEVDAIQAALGIAATDRREPAADGSYLVGHAAQVIAFGRDGLARLEYPFGTRQEDWSADLPRLARGETPPPMSETSVARVATPVIEVAQPIMPRPPTVTEAAVYVTLRNLIPGDSLSAAWSPAADSVTVHLSHTMGSVVHMASVRDLTVPADGTLSFVPGGLHLMIHGLRELPTVGHSIPVSLRLARGGDLVFAALVVDPRDLDRLAGPPGAGAPR